MTTYDEAYISGLEYKDKIFIYDRPILKNKRYYINYWRSYFWDIYYKLFLAFNPIKDDNTNYYLSICAIFKNEALFLKEWIELHILLGVDHFYLYNNNSEDDYLSILKPYIEIGTVTLIEWPDIPGQLSAYKHWYSTFRKESKWVSFLDIDEYICPRYNDTISTWLKQWEKYPTVMVYWKMFGTSGQFEHNINKLTIEQYINSWDKLDTIGKLFYNTKYDIDEFHIGLMHIFNVRVNKYKIPPINQFGKFVKYDIHRYNDKDIDIQINHYWSKAFNAYREKHKRGDATFTESPRTWDYFLWHEMRNNSIDMSIFRFVIPLKKKLGLINNWDNCLLTDK